MMRRRRVWPSRAAAAAARNRPKPVVIAVGFAAIFTIVVALELLLIEDRARSAVDMVTGDDVEPLADQPRLHFALAKRQISTFDQSPNEPPPLPPNQAEEGIAVTADGGATYPVDGDWQPVLGTKDKFLVYSAYLDTRIAGKEHVRVIGAARTRGSQKVSCVFLYDSGNPPVLIGAVTKVIRENWHLKYSAVFLLCPLGGAKAPDKVSVVLGSSMGKAGNCLKVQNTAGGVGGGSSSGGGGSSTEEGSGNSSVVDFAVCVKPLHYEFNLALQMIEFVELNRILGVNRFTFYNHSIGPDVDCVLRSYSAEGVVRMLPWKLDIVSQKEIRTEGIFAAINDCLYRNMNSVKYLVVIDTDEFIVPHKHDHLAAMMQELRSKTDMAKAGSYSFMNAFFYLQWPNDTNSKGLLPLVTLMKTRRRSRFHPHKQRSKYMVVPPFVVELGNHFVWEFVAGKGTVNVAPEVGFLHHYRVCEFGGDDCIKTVSVQDRTVYKHKGELIKKVNQRIEAVRQICPDLRL